MCIVEFGYTCNYNACTCIFPSLQGLTQVEMLISAVLHIMTLYRLPHGQYGYSGHSINLPQDIASFATNLPCIPTELDVICRAACTAVVDCMQRVLPQCEHQPRCSDPSA